MELKRFVDDRLCVRWQWSVVLVAVLVTWLQSGCGAPSGPTTYDLSGTVTFDGEPVPAGQIVFEPDSTAGNSGPQGFAEIRNGKFDTTTGKGTIGGAHIVRISGYEGGAAGGVSEEGPETEASATELFADFRTSADLPTEASTMDFAVTSDEVKGQKQAAKRAAMGP